MFILPSAPCDNQAQPYTLYINAQPARHNFATRKIQLRSPPPSPKTLPDPPYLRPIPVPYPIFIPYLYYIYPIYNRITKV